MPAGAPEQLAFAGLPPGGPRSTLAPPPDPLRYVRAGVGRRDPSTSSKAALRLERSGRLNESCQRHLAWLNKYPGRTSAELAACIATEKGEAGAWRTYRPEAGRRLPDLERHGMARKGAERRCEACGSTCVTWWPA